MDTSAGAPILLSALLFGLAAACSSGSASNGKAVPSAGSESSEGASDSAHAPDGPSHTPDGPSGTTHGSRAPSESAASATSGTTLSHEATSTGSTCVDIEITAADQACTSASDCTLAPSGKACSGMCYCPTSAVSASGASRIAAELPYPKFAECTCDSIGILACIHGVCTFCQGIGPDDTPGCPDAGRDVDMQ